MRLLLVRHGESAWNATGRWQGRADPPLSDLGRLQAHHAARALGEVDAIISSTLDRAMTTALILGEHLGVGPVLAEPELVERDAGEWSGLTRPEIEDAWPGYLDSGRRPPGYEDDASVLARALGALDSIAEHLGGPDSHAQAVVVCHGGVIYTLEAHLDAPFERIPNLGARWIGHHGDRLELGERLVLVDHDEATVQAADLL